MIRRRLMALAIGAGGDAHHAPKYLSEGAFRLISDSLGDGGHFGTVHLPEHAGGADHSPFGEMIERSLPDDCAKTGGESGARHGDVSRQRGYGPGLAGLGVHE